MLESMSVQTVNTQQQFLSYLGGLLVNSLTNFAHYSETKCSTNSLCRRADLWSPLLNSLYM